MDSDEIFNQLVEVYNDGDIDSFNRLNDEYMLNLDSIDEIADIEDREGLELDENNDITYLKNYTYSRSIVDLASHEEHKHSLELMEVHVRSYSTVIFNVILGLNIDSNLENVLDTVDLNMDKDMARDFLISNGLVEKGGLNNQKMRKMYKKYDKSELKDELALHGLSTRGSKSELINRLIKYESENTYVVTEYGMYRFMGVNWVALYNLCLNYFDFDDFEYYMTEYDTGDVVENSLNYVDENIKKGYAEKDFNRLQDSFSSLALLHINFENFEDALFNELKIFILKLNPLFLDNYELKDYIPIHYSNINNIEALSTLSEIDDLKDIFNTAWDDIEYDKKLTSKDDAYRYLKEAMDDNIDELNDKITFVKTTDNKIKQRENELIEMTSSFCEEYLDDEYRKLSKKLIQKLARKHDVPFKRGKLEIWAGGIIYALGQINFLFDDSFDPFITPDDICNYFSCKKSSASNKARDIRKLLNLKLGDKEFSTSFIQMHNLHPNTDLSQVKSLDGAQSRFYLEESAKLFRKLAKRR